MNECLIWDNAGGYHSKLLFRANGSPVEAVQNLKDKLGVDFYKVFSLSLEVIYG